MWRELLGSKIAKGLPVDRQQSSTIQFAMIQNCECLPVPSAGVLLNLIWLPRCATTSKPNEARIL